MIKWMEVQTPSPPDLSNSWRIFFDGSERQQGVGAGVVLISPNGEKLRYILQINFEKASKNEAEYEYVMRMEKACGATRLIIYDESNLVVQQTMREYEAFVD